MSQNDQLFQSSLALNNEEGFNAYIYFAFLIKSLKITLMKGHNRFLKIISIHCSMKKAMMIIVFYDIDNALSLSYSNFIHFLIGKGMGLNRTIKYPLTRLIEKEIDLVRSIEPILDDIKTRKDDSEYDMFNDLKDVDLPYITI